VGRANGSRERAPDDRLRDRLPQMMGIAALNPSYRTTVNAKAA